MSGSILYGPPSETLTLLLGAADFAAPERILGHLSARLAVSRLPNAPHSIAEIVAHMHHNMLFNLDLIERREPVTRPDWPAVAEHEWSALVNGFFEVVAALRHHAQSPLVLKEVIFPLTTTEPAWTAGYKLTVNVAQHNAYHFGQIVTLRQLLDAWPDGDRE